MSMSLRSYFACLAMLCVLAVPAAAQKSVTVDLATGEFKQPVPFDEEFWLTGTNDKTAKEVTLKYGKLGKGKCLPTKQYGICDPAPTTLTNEKTSKNVGTATTFKFLIEKLSPNTCYTFFVTQNLLPAGEDDRKKVREAVSKEFRTKLSARIDDGTLLESELANIEAELQGIAKETVKTQLAACFQGKIDLMSPDATKVREEALRLNLVLKDAKNNVPGRTIEVIRNLCLEICSNNVCRRPECVAATTLSAFRKSLVDLIADPTVLSPASATEWGWMEPIAKALSGATDSALEEALRGKRELTNADLDPVGENDPYALRVGAFLATYTSRTFRKRTNGDTTPVLDPAVAIKIRGTRWAGTFRTDLARLLADPTGLTPAAAEEWKRMAPIARALVRSNDVMLRELIEGRRNFADGELAPTTAPDPQALRALGNFFDIYIDPTFRRKTNNGSEPVVEPELATYLRGAIPIRDLANEISLRDTTKARFEAVQLADILANQVLTRGYDLSAAPAVVTEGKNAYIGVDAGMGYAFNLDKPYVYVGTNFYRVPINKDEKIPWFSGGGIWKRGSILLGLASAVDGTKNLVGPGSPMLGAGYRVRRYIKVSGGWIVFKQKDKNPVIDKDHVKVQPFFSLSIDTDLKALLGGIGKLFGQ